MTNPRTEPQSKEKPVSEKPTPISMHEDVPVWYDCCTCEAEPHWLAVAEELGIELCENRENGLESGSCEDSGEPESR